MSQHDYSRRRIWFEGNHCVYREHKISCHNIFGSTFHNSSIEGAFDCSHIYPKSCTDHYNSQEVWYQRSAMGLAGRSKGQDDRHCSSPRNDLIRKTLLPNLILVLSNCIVCNVSVWSFCYLLSKYVFSRIELVLLGGLIKPVISLSCFRIIWRISY